MVVGGTYDDKKVEKTGGRREVQVQIMKLQLPSS